MIDHILFSLYMSMVICGLYMSAQEGMILNFVKRFFNKTKVLSEIGMPVILCPTCMASVWGLTGYWLMYKTIDIYVIPSILSIAYINTVLIAIYYKIKD